MAADESSPAADDSADHICEDLLEAYALGRLAEPTVVAVKEHLLICESCRARLVEVERFVRAMRGAVGELK